MCFMKYEKNRPDWHERSSSALTHPHYFIILQDYLQSYKYFSKISRYHT